MRDATRDEPAGGQAARRTGGRLGRPWSRRLRAAAGIGALTLVAGLAGGAAAAGAAPVLPAVSPAPGAMLTGSPRDAAVRLPGPPPAGSTLEILGSDGSDMGTGPTTARGDLLERAAQPLAPGVYTLVWQAGASAGSSTFTVWHGGPLPAEALRAERGGPTLRPIGHLGGLAAALALCEAVAALGAAVYGGRRAPGVIRRAGLGIFAGALYWALAHAAAASGAPPLAVPLSPLGRVLLLHGVGRDALLCAVAGFVILCLPRRAGAAAACFAALALALAAAAIPVLRGSGAPAVAVTCAALGLAGAGLYAGPWLVARRRREEPPVPALPRVAGAALAVLGGGALALLLGFRPRHEPLADAALALLALAGLLGRPGARGAAAQGAALLSGAAAAILISPALASAAPLAGRALVPPVSAWALRSEEPGSAGSAVALDLASGQPGANVIRVRDAGWPGDRLVLRAASAAQPSVARSVTLPETSPGVFEAASDAFSLPGAWKVSAGGASFVLVVGDPPEVDGCPLGFSDLRVAVAGLPGGGPVTAFAVDPGDGSQALAATARGVFATRNGGLDWSAATGPGGATVLAVGRYGEWFAGGAGGLSASQDGGAAWAPVGGIPGAVAAMADPLYPDGTPAWVLSAGEVLQSVLQYTPQGFVPGWLATGQAPAGARLLVALPTGGTGADLAAGGAPGLEVSTDGGRDWTSEAPGLGAVAALARGGSGLWAAGQGGLWQAPAALGPWTAMPLGANGGPVSGLAVGGSVGQDVLAFVPGRGLLWSADAGAAWTNLGCPDLAPSAMASAFQPGGPNKGTGPLGYIGLADGQVLAVLPPAGAGSAQPGQGAAG